MNDLKNKLNVLDIYCGVGTFSYGLKEVGLNIIAGIEPRKYENIGYKSNLNVECVRSTLSDFPPKDFSDLMKINKSGIDVIVGRPPIAGRDGEKKINIEKTELSLFLGYVGFFQPKFVLIEMPKRNFEHSQEKDHVFNCLETDYHCSYYTLNCSDYSIPQERKHTFIVACLKKFKLEELEPPRTETEKKMTIKDCLIPKKNLENVGYLSEHAYEKVLNLLNGERKNYSPKIINVDLPSPTITSRYWKDGYDALVHYEQDHKMRRLQILELKRIQTIPDNFSIKGSKKEMIRQIGDSIPCEMAKKFGSYFKELTK
jgi:DNA (cytosine-5)-methyltransferase 1